MSIFATIPPWQIHTMNAELPYFHESAAGVVGDIGLAGVSTGGLLVGVYDECIPAQIFESTDCDCRESLIVSRERIAAEGLGILFSLKGGNVHPGQDYTYGQGRSPHPPERYAYCARFLVDKGIGKVRFINSDTIKISALEHAGIEVIAA